MGVGLNLVGAIERRGLFGRAQSSSSWLEEAGRWVWKAAREPLESARLAEGERGVEALYLKLHPAAEEVELAAAEEAGRIIVAASTSTVGPGYHVYLCRFLERLGPELGLRWDAPDEEEGTGDETGFFHTGDRAAVDRQMLAWLQSVAARLLEELSGETTAQIALPMDVLYEPDGPVATATGPRDEAWLRPTATDPSEGIDFFSWWQDEMGAAYYLGRATVLMWTEVRWRPPLTDSEERRLDEVLEYLKRAHEMDPALDYPWVEWAELLDYRGHRSRLADEVRSRATEARRPPLIGYRRRPVRVAFVAGWTIRVPGSFLEEPSEEGWSAGDANRAVYASITSVAERGGAPVPAADLVEAAEPLTPETLTYEGEGLVGRARLVPDRSLHWPNPTEPRSALQGVMAAAGELVVVRIAFEDPGGRDWAIESWQSLRHGIWDKP